MAQKYAAEIVNQACPGRVRLKVFAMYRQDSLKSQLEQAIWQLDYVESVQGNSLTGSLLILFNPAQTETSRFMAELASIVGPIASRSLAPPQGQTQKELRSSQTTVKPARSLFARKDAKKSRQFAPEGRQSIRPLECEWHTLSAAAALAKLESTEAGLSNATALARLSVYGPNRLEENKRRSALTMIGEQFLSIPVALLGVSAVVSLTTGGVADAIVIGGVVLIVNFRRSSFSESAILGSAFPRDTTRGL
jgi:Ca2+-transporting ATPase